MANGEADIWGLVERAKDWLIPLAGATPAALLGFLAGRKKADAEATKAKAEATKADAEADAVIADALTRRFKALIDGYEARIADLTAEVHSLRDEVKALRQALDARPKPAAPRNGDVRDLDF